MTQGVGRNGKRFVKNNSKAGTKWAKVVLRHCLAEGLEQVQPPYHVQIDFYFARPKKPTYPYPPLDVDKLARCTLDALAGSGVIVDDRHVVILHATKEYAGDVFSPGAVITVRHIRWP